MNKKKSILFCLTEVPYPVRRNGLSIRYFPIIEHFSETYDIDLLLILTDPISEEDVEALKKVSKNLYCLIQSECKPGILRKIFVHLSAYVPGMQPLEVYNYNNREVEEFIISKTTGKHYDIKLCVSLSSADFLYKHVSADRYVIDGIDSLYSYLHRSYEGGLISSYKLALIKKWELNLISKADSVSYVSPLDVEVLTEGSNIKNIQVVPNGIYIDDYVSSKSAVEGFVIGFLGNMDYHPNVQAALMLSEIFLGLKEERENIKLLIIGRNPSESIVELKRHEGITVTGSVDSIWPYVNATDIFVFPMTYGTGQQNKLLDVMYAGRPVISTSLGNSGIGAKNGRDLVLADTSEEIKNKILELYDDAAKLESLAVNGKCFIEKKYGWNTIFEKIESVYFDNVRIKT